MALPNFLCIGAQKAGTTWLHQMIKQHPNIWMPPIKEIHFFNHLFIESDRKWTTEFIKCSVQEKILRHIRGVPARPIDYRYLRYLIDIASREPFTEGWYHRIFDRPGAREKTLGETTPAYSTMPLDGVRYVRQLLGEVRVVYIIRDPVERLLSQLRMTVTYRGRAPANDEAWLKWAVAAGVENRSDYAQFVPFWQATFPADQLLFVPYGDIGADPANLLRRIENFIGLQRYDGYMGLKTRIGKTAPITIPGVVVELISSRMERQGQFLKSVFGSDFVAKCGGSRTNDSETSMLPVREVVR